MVLKGYNFTTMHLNKLIITAGICATFFIACKKSPVEQNTTSTTPGDDNTCVQSTGSRDGQLVDGRYIVTFNSNTTSRSFSEARVREISQSILERNNINTNVLKEDFGGE